MGANLQKPTALHPLTSLRFFVSFAIVIGHILPTAAGIPGDARYGLGVGFFFVLSGFILTYVYRDFTGHSIGAFYLARFARLWPVHLVTFLIAALVIQPQALLSPLHAMTALINVLMLQAWLPVNGLVMSWNGPSWSISAELWFYLIFPFLAMTRRIWFWVTALVAVVAAILAFTPITEPKPWQFTYVHMVMQHPAVRVLEFAVGVVAGRLFNAGHRIRGPGTILEIAAIFGVALFAVTSVAVQQQLAGAGLTLAGLWYSQSGGLVVFAAAIFIFAQHAGAVARALSWRPLILLGEISFSTYMLHQLLIRFAMKYGWIGEVGRPATLTILVVLIYPGSYLLWRFVELPARRKIIGAAGQKSAPLQLAS